MRYKVVGDNAVAGVQPGGTVDLDLPDENIDALIRSGNIAAQRSQAKKPRKPAKKSTETTGGEG